MAEDPKAANTNDQAAPQDQPKQQTGADTSASGGDAVDPYANVRGAAAHDMPDIDLLGQQAQEMHRMYASGRAYTSGVYSQFADLEYGMRIVKEKVDQLDKTTQPDDIRHACQDIRLIIFQLRGVCHEAGTYGDY